MVIFWMAVWTLVERELVRFWRDKARVLGVVASPLLFWMVLGFGAGGTAPKFFYPGMLVLTVMFSAIFSTISIIEDRREGFLLSMLVSPAPRASLVLGKILGATVLAALQGGALLAFAPMAGVTSSAMILAGAATGILLVAFAMSAFGFFIAWKFDSSQAYHAIMNLVMLPMWLVSGAVFSMDGAQFWMRTVMSINPMTYFVGLIRHLLLSGETAAPSASASVGVTAGFGIVMMIASAALAGRRASRMSA